MKYIRQLPGLFLRGCVLLAALGAAGQEGLPSVAPGFRVERLRSTQAGGDSWVSMTVDAQGRLIISPQGPGGYLVQVTLSGEGQVARMQKIDLPVGSAMGLLYAFDSLYVDGDGPKGFGVYRLGHNGVTDRYEFPRLIQRFGGYPPHEHGAHGVVLGKDGHLYVVCGNFVLPPRPLSAISPLRNFGVDQLLAPDDDADGYGLGMTPPEGFVVRMGPDGEDPELFCGGLRNVYDIAFNADGEAFGLDNDPNCDWGLPWYRPNGLYHLVSGADYGYREGTAKWPRDYADGWPGTFDTGLGCPTGVKFGEGGNFPGKYRKALYALDWCSGRILAIYLTPKGASYQASCETFLQGQALNVTDVEFGRDGAMYFITGGRKTQSGLYRVSYVGPKQNPEPAVRDPAAARARELRRALERFHGIRRARAVDFAWPFLDSDDPYLRRAARVAIESQPVEEWTERAVGETRTNASLAGLLALARCGGPARQKPLLDRLARWPLQRLSEEGQLEKLRVIELSFIRQGKPDAALAEMVRKELDAAYPSRSPRLNAELCALLVYLQGEDVAGKTLALVDGAATQEEQIQYIFCLRLLQSGWTLQQRQHYFGWFEQPHDSPPPSEPLQKWFAEAGRPYANGTSFAGYLANFRKEALEGMSAAERAALAPWLLAHTPAPVKASPLQQRAFVRNWSMGDLLPLVSKGMAGGRPPARGEKIFASAGCIQCHRFGASGGSVGPDLTVISRSASQRDILESILEPSKVIAEQYRTTTLLTADGDELSGRVVGETPAEVTLMTDLINRTTVKVPKKNIQKREVSAVSPMPEGLLNCFTTEEILDLIAFLESGGMAAAPSVKTN